YLRTEGMSHDEAMNFMHQKLDEGVAYLKQEGVASVLHENVGVREKGLSRQFHASPERLKNMHAEAQRRIANAKQTEGPDNGAINGRSDQDRPAALAGGKSGSSQATVGKPQEGQVANVETKEDRTDLRDRQ